MSEAQENKAIMRMAEAGITAYCESHNIPVEMLKNIGGTDRYLVKRQAKSMAVELDRIVMANIGPQLIRFWSLQGCPELPPS